MTTYVYVSLQDEDKVLVYTMDANTGALTAGGQASVEGGPAAMAINPARTTIYVGRRGLQDIASFRVDQNDGNLSLIGTASLQGEPVHLSHRPAGEVCSFGLLLPEDRRGTPGQRRRRR